MNRSIPQVRPWRVRVLDDNGAHKATLFIETINSRMARLIVHLDYPQFWGCRLVVYPLPRV